MIFYPTLLKVASEAHNSKHLSEEDRLRLYDEYMERLSRRSHRSGTWRKGAVVGAIGGGLVGGGLPGALVGLPVGVIIGRQLDDEYNAHTHDARRHLLMSPEDRRRAYLEQYALYQDALEKDMRDVHKRHTRAAERQAAAAERQARFEREREARLDTERFRDRFMNKHSR